MNMNENVQYGYSYKTRNIICIFLTLILAGHSISCVSQTLSETEEFIRKNIAIDYAHASNTKNIIEVSCSKTGGKAIYEDGSSNFIYFKPSEVEYLTVPGKDKGESFFIGVQCISGECISTDMFSLHMESYDHLRSIIDSSRTISALKHQQKLCGGAIKTPF